MPVLFDILALFNFIHPLHRKVRGIISGPQIAAWLNKLMVRWFLIRSLPEALRSRGYQYKNYFLIYFRISILGC